MELNIVSDDSYTEDVEKYILHNINEKIGQGNIDVTIRYVKETDLKYTKRNKLMLVVNEIPTACVGGG